MKIIITSGEIIDTENYKEVGDGINVVYFTKSGKQCTGRKYEREVDTVERILSNYA